MLAISGLTPTTLAGHIASVNKQIASMVSQDLHYRYASPL
jgi:hypothetical protein